MILRDPTTGDHTEIRLGEKGTLIGQQPRSVSELAERFTTAELTEWQAAETTRATTPETSTTTATQTTGSGTGWTTATNVGVLAGSAAVLSALTTAARGTKGERPEGAANQTETETDGSESSEGSGAGTETDTTDTGTDTQGGETDTEGDEEDTDAGMPTDQGTDTDEEDADAHMTTNPSTDTSDGDEGMEGDQTPDKDQQTDGAVAPAQVTDGDEEDGTETDGGEENPDEGDDPDESVDQGAEAEGANIEVGRAEGAGGTDSTDPQPDAGSAIEGSNPMPQPQPNTPGSVTLTGTATEDETLTATVTDTDGLPDDAANIRYQWQRDTGADSAFENIENATSPTYTLGDEDVGRNIRVVVNYTDRRGTDESPTSNTTTAVTNINDEPTGSVTIDGTVREDQTLTAKTGTLDDADGLGAFSYQWHRSNGSGGFEDIANATGETYSLGDADVGREVQVMVSYTDDGGMDESLTSDATAAVGNVNDLPTGDVTIDGTVRGDETLTANTGALADEDGLPDDVAGYNYQWQRSDGSGGYENIDGATSQTYTLVNEDIGREVRVQVSYTDGNNTSENMNSMPTAEVINANIAPTGGVRIDGTVRQGQELSADTKALRDADGLPDSASGYRYQWQRTGADGTFADIEDATEQTYTVAAADVGQRLQVVVRYTDGNGADESLTAATVSPAASNANDPVIEDDANIMNGDGNNNQLVGDVGNQRLNGLGGDDILVGYAGADILDGGAGNDVFSFAPGVGSDRITDFGTGDDRLQFEFGLFANLEAVIAAASNTDDGNLEIALSETETLTLAGVTLAALTADTVTTLDASGNDTTTPPADANSANDAPAFELDDLAIDEESLMRLAASEGMTLPPSEPQTAQTASEKLALADPLEPPPALALFDTDLEGYAGL